MTTNDPLHAGDIDVSVLSAYRQQVGHHREKLLPGDPSNSSSYAFSVSAEEVSLGGSSPSFDVGHNVQTRIKKIFVVGDRSCREASGMGGRLPPRDLQARKRRGSMREAKHSSGCMLRKHERHRTVQDESLTNEGAW